MIRKICSRKLLKCEFCQNLDTSSSTSSQGNREKRVFQQQNFFRGWGLWDSHGEPKSWYAQGTSASKSLERLHQRCCRRAVVIFGCDCTDEDVPGEWQRAIRCNFKRRSARKDFLAFLACASCRERKKMMAISNDQRRLNLLWWSNLERLIVIKNNN